MLENEDPDRMRQGCGDFLKKCRIWKWALLQFLFCHALNITWLVTRLCVCTTLADKKQMCADLPSAGLPEWYHLGPWLAHPWAWLHPAFIMPAEALTSWR